MKNISWKWAATGAAILAGLALGATVLAQNVGHYGDGAGETRPLARGEVDPPINTLSYQGRLTGPLGQPISSTVNVVFRLMDESGQAIYTSAAKSVTPDAAGLFTAAIGDAADSPITRSNYLDRASAVQVIINGTPLTPTQPLNTLVGSSGTGTGVVGRSRTVGVAGYASNSDGWGVLGRSESGFGVRGASVAGNGVVGVSETGFAVEAQGHIKQSLDKGGALKAALDTSVDGKCFNGQAAGANVSTGSCGFTVTRPSPGLVKVDFGFMVTDRFVQVTPVLMDGAAGIAQIAGYDGTNVVIIKTWTLSGAGPAAATMPFVVTIH